VVLTEALACWIQELYLKLLVAVIPNSESASFVAFVGSTSKLITFENEVLVPIRRYKQDYLAAYYAQMAVWGIVSETLLHKYISICSLILRVSIIRPKAQNHEN
jgi:hypothetical protein